MAEPAERIPPGVLVEGRAQLARLERLVPVELEVGDLRALALLDLHRDLHRAGDALHRLDDRLHLHVGEELLLVLAADAASGSGDLRLAVRIAVLQLGELGDLALVPVVAALHGERALEAHLVLHDVGDVDAVQALLGLHHDVVERARVAQRPHVARALRRIVLVAHLDLAARGGIAHVLHVTVGGLHRNGRHLRRRRHARHGQRHGQNHSLHRIFLAVLTSLPSSTT